MAARSVSPARRGALTCRCARLAANPGPPVAKDKRAPKPGPKTVFIPKWKQEKLDKLPEGERKAKLEAFKARWVAAPASA